MTQRCYGDVCSLMPPQTLGGGGGSFQDQVSQSREFRAPYTLKPSLHPLDSLLSPTCSEKKGVAAALGPRNPWDM